MSAIVDKTEEKACEVSANYWTAKDMTEEAKEAAKQGILKKSGYFNQDGYGGLSESFDKENVDTVLEGTRKDGALGQSLRNKKNS